MVYSLFYGEAQLFIALTLSQKIQLQTSESYKRLHKVVTETTFNQVMKQDKYYFLMTSQDTAEILIWPFPSSVLKPCMPEILPENCEGGQRFVWWGRMKNAVYYILRGCLVVT